MTSPFDNLFEKLSAIANPQDGKTFMLKFRIQQLEADLQLHLTAMNDIEVELQTLKSQLNDTTKTHPHPASTIVLDDDYDMAHPV